MKNRYIIIPEINRVKHSIGGGVHVTGWFQAMQFDKQPMNLLPWPLIQLQRIWESTYSVDIMRLIEKAEVVNVTKHPCDESPIPKHSVSVEVRKYFN